MTPEAFFRCLLLDFLVGGPPCLLLAGVVGPFFENLNLAEQQCSLLHLTLT